MSRSTPTFFNNNYRHNILNLLTKTRLLLLLSASPCPSSIPNTLRNSMDDDYTQFPNMHCSVIVMLFVSSINISYYKSVLKLSQLIHTAFSYLPFFVAFFKKRQFYRCNVLLQGCTLF